jgi:glutamate synthase (NADPH/NADH) large chain
MSGGMAFVFDPSRALRSRTNLDSVDLESVSDESDLWLLQQLLEDHVRFTGSALGRRILDTWPDPAARFMKVMPIEYRRVLAARRAAQRARTTSQQLAAEVRGG